jgi:hypothetical protein
MSDVVAFLWIVAGVILSVLVPWAASILNPQDERESSLQRYLPYAGAALVIGLFTLVVIKFADGSLKTWYEALMVGYFWEATLEKIKPPA